MKKFDSKGKLFLSSIALFISINLFSESLIEEVVVTAEKRAASLQDVSKSVTALTEEELETKNIVDFVGLSAIAPGVTVAKNEGYKTVISIRGVAPSFKLMIGVFFVTGNQGLYASIRPFQLFFCGTEVKNCFNFFENATS